MATRKQETQGARQREIEKIGEKGGSWQIEMSGLCERLQPRDIDHSAEASTKELEHNYRA